MVNGFLETEDLIDAWKGNMQRSEVKVPWEEIVGFFSVIWEGPNW